MSVVGLYRREVLTRKVSLDFKYVGSTTKQNIEKWLQEQLEGKCTIEGFIRPNSIKVITYSSGKVHSHYVVFETVFECSVCSLVEGMKFDCVVENITKAGVLAKALNEDPSPVTVFCTRDHHHDNPTFGSLKEGDEISVRVIGQRFELNDTKISVIAQYISPSNPTTTTKENVLTLKAKKRTY